MNKCIKQKPSRLERLAMLAVKTGKTYQVYSSRMYDGIPAVSEAVYKRLQSEVVS